MIKEGDWDLFPNFSKKEFACKHTGQCQMQFAFMQKLQDIRTVFAKPLIISSGYRDPSHPAEIGKPKRPNGKRGEHTYGLATDILIYGEDAIRLLGIAIDHDIKRIGISQKGPLTERFIHLGMGQNYDGFPQTVWSY